MIELKLVPAGKSSAALRLVAPRGKTRSEPLCGATAPTQFAAVIQLLSLPAPVQVAVDGVIRTSSASRPGRRARRPLLEGPYRRLDQR